jgi:DNA-binding SARP family transcriptional activator
VRFEILGPVRTVDEAGNQAFLSSHKVEVLLSALLVRSNDVVSVAQLVGEVWGERPPRRATDALYVYVSRLRKFLGGCARSDSHLITRTHGYALRMGSDELDVHAFQRLVRAGRTHARAERYEQALTECERALALWRGPVLDFPERGPVIQSFLTWLEEERLDCHELLIQSCMAVGRHREVIGRLQSMIKEHPLRETLYQHLMRALYHSGRKAEALAVYQSARMTLRREIGLEPGRTLQHLQRAILTADDLDRPSAA